MDLPVPRVPAKPSTRWWELRWELSALLFLLIAWGLGPLLWWRSSSLGAWSTVLWLGGALPFLGSLLLRLRSLRRQLSAELGRHDHAKRLLRLHEAQRDALLNVLPDLTFRLDASGNVTNLGGAGARARALPVDCPLSKLVPEAVAGQLLDCAREVGRTGALGRLEYQVREEDEVSDFEARIARCDDRQLVVMIRGVTQRKRLERELISAREGALEAARVKTKFLANMSHEIRTPMNGVIGMTTLLLETPLSTEQQEYANIIQKSGEALLGIIDDILDFAKIEAGKLELEEVDFDLFACVDESVEAVASQAESKRLELGAVFAPGLSARVRGDPTRLRQVLANLLNNAVRYTERGFVLVRVGRASGGDGSLLEFSVQDSGPGIAEAAQKTLFHPVLLGEGGASAGGGAGLGLAIARQLVQLMGGEMACETTAEEGSLFRFTARLSPRDSGRNSLESSLFYDAPSRVLLVGADDRALWPLAEQLTALSVKSLQVGPEQLAAAMRPEPEGVPCFCVVIDARLEPAVVQRVLEQVRGDASVTDTSVVIVARSEGAQVAELRKDATRVIGWPVRQTELFACLSALLNRAQSIRAIKGSLAPVTEARVLVADDDPINQRVLRRILGQLGFTCELVSDGAQAVEKVISSQFDVVLMDCQMPWMDGFEATRQIRAHEAAGGRRTCIVALTASSSDEDRRLSREAQMDGFLTKPATAEQLHEAITRVLRDSAANTHLLAPPRSREPTFDAARLAGLRAADASNDGAAAKAAIERFLEQAPRNLDAMRAALDVRDFEAVAKAAHNLESSSAYLGALRLSRLSSELERLTRSERVASVERGLESVRAELDIVRRELSAGQPA
jgi:signal transduction histidine kinase/CheY-like chemotaxis protein/HPt (histidine-containing phosphotransfer) domain-containing protein